MLDISFVFAICNYFIDMRMTSNDKNKTYRKKREMSYIVFYPKSHFIILFILTLVKAYPNHRR